MISFALPERCLHCAAPTAATRANQFHRTLENYLCHDCLRIHRSSQSVSESDLRQRFIEVIPSIKLKNVTAVWKFHDKLPIRAMVHASKYQGMLQLTHLLGAQLQEQLHPVLEEIDIIIPVPLHRTKRLQRGYNQAEELAKAIADSKIRSELVKRRIPTKSQTKLNAEERLRNMEGAFALRKTSGDISGKHILIVDDIMTTGATLASVASTVAMASPSSVSIAVVAVASFRDVSLTQAEFPTQLR